MKNTKQLLALSLLLIALMVGGGVLFSKARLKNSGPALYAAASKDSDEALSLIESGAPVDYVDPKRGDTPLHRAANGRSDAVITALLAHGAKVDALSKSGMTPLDAAASLGQVSTVKLLLSKGANPQERNKFGRTSLQDAQGKLRLRRPSPREKVVYPQVVALLEAATRPAK